MYFTLTTFIDFCFVNKICTCWCCWCCCSAASWPTILEIICINSSPLFWRKKTHWGNQWACSTQGLSSASQLVNPPPQWKHRTRSMVPKHINSYFTIYVVIYILQPPYTVYSLMANLSLKCFNLMGRGYVFPPSRNFFYNTKQKSKIGICSSKFLV